MTRAARIPERSRGRCALRVAAAACALLATSAAHATWAFGSPIPVKRLIENMTAYVGEHPDDAAGHYALGRLHSYAFDVGRDAVQGYVREDPDPDPGIIPRDRSHPGPGPGPVPWRDEDSKPIPVGERLGHLEAAIACFDRALDVEFPEDTPYLGTDACELSLGYVLEHGADHAAEVDVLPGLDPDTKVSDKQRAAIIELARRAATERRGRARHGMASTGWRWLFNYGDKAVVVLYSVRDGDEGVDRAVVGEILRRHWLREAAHHYLWAFRLAFDDDLANGSPSGSNGYRELVSYEAGRSYLRALFAAGDTPDDRTAITEVNEGLRKLEEKDWGPGWITPLVFSLDAGVDLSDLVDDEASVTFDLDGTGREQRWGWVRPGTGILVWDPGRTGAITSGRQLFGSVSWWVFFGDGYKALAALDDDRDGLVADDELHGIGAWFDRDGDGVSDAGEVVPLGELGVGALRTRGAEPVPGGLRLRYGLVLADGRTLDTFDWVAHGHPTEGGSR